MRKKKKWKEKNKSWKEWKGHKKRKNKRKIPKNCGKKVDEEYKLQSVIFIQHIPYSKLAKRIREKLGDLEKIGRVKMKLVCPMQI